MNSEIETAFAERLTFLGRLAARETQPVNSEIEKAFAKRLTLLGRLAARETQPVNSEIEKAFAEQKPTFQSLFNHSQKKKRARGPSLATELALKS